MFRFELYTVNYGVFYPDDALGHLFAVFKKKIRGECMNKTRYAMFIVTLFIVFALSAMNAAPAFADDGNPPPPEPTETTDPPLVESDPLDTDEAPPPDLPVEVIVEESPTPAEAVTLAGQEEEESITEPESPAELLSQVPEGTDVMVVNAEGEVVPLVSEEAAQIIDLNDPIWCPTGVAPNPGVGGCTTTQTSFNGGLLPLIANKTVNGTIWILGSYTGTALLEGGAVTLDGSLLGTTANFALTIQGGWTGASTGTLVDTLNPSEFNVPLSIINWNADVTLSDLLITGDTISFTALEVETTKNIVVKNVQVSNNDFGGAYLDNSGGTGTVTVSNSKFNSNSFGIGFQIVSKGVITLANIQVNYNGTNGAIVDNSFGTGAAVTVTSSSFNLNGAGGLEVISKGVITLNNVLANSNGNEGAGLDNRTAATPMAVNITSSEFNWNGQTDFDSALQSGLFVFSKGLVTIKDIDANNNGNTDSDFFDRGVYIDNTAGTAGVTFLGTNIISDNEYGVSISSYGAVTLSNMIVNNNTHNGLYINNCGWNGTSCNPLYSASVSLLGTNEFKFNATAGLRIYTNGAIALNNITANNNYGTCETCGGVYLWNAESPTSANVTLTGINTFRENSMTGLQVYSKGVITLNNITASDNGWYDSDNLSLTFDQYFGNGAYIDNTFATTPKAVTLAGLSNSFLGNATTGLVILSKGAIVANNLSASMNGWFDPSDADSTDSSHGDGAYLDNCLYSDNGTPLDFSDDYCSNPVPASFVKLTGTNTFNNNGWGDGLEISTLGVITINNLTANDNGGRGAYLYNNWMYWNAPTSAYKFSYNGITITGYAITSNNGLRGMSIYSAGAVSVINVNASNNGSIGLRIYNAMDPAQPKPISLLGTNVFNGNWQDGLKITGYGAVTTNNVSARWNGHYDDIADTYYGYGAYIDNCGWDGANCNASSLASAVTMNGTNTFWDNNLSGLQVYSKGAIKVNSLTSNWNGRVDSLDANPADSSYGYGAFLYNRDGIAPVTITGTNTYFESNWNSGLHVESRGAITIGNLTSNWNGQENGYYNDADPFDANDANGVYLDNMWAGAMGDVAIVGYGRVDGNLEYGIEIYSNGAVKLANINAVNNGFKGAHVENSALAVTPKAVAISGNNNFNGNGAHGLVIKSYGVITLNNINASWNGGAFNAYINNCQFGTTGCTALVQAAITMTGVNNFDGNWGGGSGLYMQSFGNITVNNLSASNNNGVGAYIDNQWLNQAVVPVASTGNLTITGYANFDGNGQSGLSALSNGNITIANLNANNNGGNGYTGGAFLSAEKPGIGVANVVLTGFNNLNQNYGGNGLNVFADGAITIANLTANENWDGDGAYLDNMATSTIPMAVTLTGFNNFWHNYLNGLTILSYGAVTVSNIDASSNGIDETWSNVAGPEYGWGLYIDNRNPVALSAKPVTLTGFNYFFSNWNSGLEIWSSNLVTLSNVTANYSGTYYDDLYSYAGANDTYVGCGDQTIDNGDNDFYVGCGAYIDNSSAATPLNVVLLGVNEFNGNTHHGLTVISKGQLLLNSLTSNWNGWFSGSDASPDTVFGSGAYLVSTMKGITFSGNNTFDGNWDDGLFAQSLDLITVNNLNANSNGGIGAYLDNLWDVKHSDVVVKGYSNGNNNGSDGIVIFTNGSAILANVAVISNAGNGLYIEAYDNNPAPLGKPSNVSISGTNWFWGNGVDGLTVLADGVITLNNINASHNGNNGATIDGISAGYWMPLPAVRLNITGSNNFNGNGNNGLFFDTFGNVTLTRVTADNNFGTGVVGTTTGNITYTCGSVTRNNSLGYDLNAVGGILTLAGVSSTGNLGNLTNAFSVVRVRTCPLP